MNGGEGILILLVGAFLVLPLPLCIYLLVQVSKLKGKMRKHFGQAENPHEVTDTVAKQADLLALKRMVAYLEKKVIALETQNKAVPPVISKEAVQKESAVSTPVISPVVKVEEKAEAAPQPVAVMPTIAQPEIVKPVLSAEETLRKAFQTAQAKQPQSASSTNTPTDTGPSLADKMVQGLRVIGLLPPKDRARGEADLMQWWAPRAGGMLAVLAVIFFAVYVANSAPPWVRFLELLAGDAIVIGLGFRLLKKHRNLGQVVLATGLSMLYVSSMAAYVARPIRIIDDPAIGLAFQLGVLALNIAVGLRLGFRNVVLLSLLYGYGSALFSAIEGLREGALLTALCLHIGGMALHRKLQWLPLLSLGVLCYTLPVFGFLVLHSVGGNVTLPWLESVLIYLAIGLSILPLKDRFDSQVIDGENRLWRFLMGFNTSIGLLVGYLYTKAFQAPMLDLFYGGAAALFLVWAALYWIRDARGYAFHLWFLKGSALTVLFTVTHYHGAVRWYALAVEAVLLAWTARRNRSPWLEAAVYACGAIAFFSWSDNPLHTKLALNDFLWWMHATFPLILITASGILYGGKALAPQRRALVSIIAVLMSVVLIYVMDRADVIRSQRPLLLLASAVALGAMSMIPRLEAWAFRIATIILFIAAHVSYWLAPSSVFAGSGLLVLSGAAIYFLQRSIAQAHPTKLWQLQLAEAAIHALWVLSLLSHLKEYPLSAWHLLTGPVMGLGFLLIARGYLRGLADVAFWPVLIILIGTNESGPEGTARLVVFISTLVIVSCMLLTVVLPAKESAYNLLQPKRLWSWVWTLLLGGWLARYLLVFDSWLFEQLFLSGLAILIFYSWKRAKVTAWAVTSCGLLFAMLVHYLQVTPQGRGDNYPNGSEILMVGLFQIALLLWLSEGYRKTLSNGLLPAFIGPMAGYLIALKLVHYPLLDMARHRTILIALYCLLLLILGFITLNKQARLVAIYGFLIPIFWLFVYDIKDTLIRIIAFGALAGLLIGIGYLYNRYKDRLKG